MQFKPTLVKPYTHVYSGDPAIDKSHPDHNPELYAKTGEEKYLPTNGKGQPDRWRLRHLTGSDRRYMQRFADDLSCMVRVAAALGVIGVEGATGEDGQPFEIRRVADAKFKVMLVEDDTLDVLDSVDNGSLLNELGGRVIRETFGDPT